MIGGGCFRFFQVTVKVKRVWTCVRRQIRMVPRCLVAL